MNDNRAIQPKGDTTLSDNVVDVEYSEVNPQIDNSTSSKLKQAGDKLKQAGKSFGNIGRGLGQVAGQTLNIGSQFKQGFQETRQSFDSNRIRQGIRTNIQPSSPSGMSSGILNISKLPPTPAKRPGHSGRPQTKVVIKKKGLMSIGGTETDFEKLITLEELTKGRVPIGLPPTSQTPLGMSSPMNNIGNIQRLTQPREVNIDKLRQLSRSGIPQQSYDIERMRSFVNQTQPDINNLEKVRGFTNSMSDREKSLNKLRRFL